MHAIYMMHACHVGDTWHACMHTMQIGPVYKNGPVEEKRKKKKKERKEEKKGVSRSEQTQTTKNLELHYKRYVSPYSGSFHA